MGNRGRKRYSISSLCPDSTNDPATGIKIWFISREEDKGTCRERGKGRESKVTRIFICREGDN